MNTDQFFFSTFKAVWKRLRFSLVHFSPTKEECVKEFYQTLYESFFLVWKELALVVDKANQQLYTLLLAYGLYTTYKTCQLETKPRIELD